ncbi:hypothetical protein PG994_009948 [Apiospora phragmitis]|uniref:Transcription factor domain-containing protein n=1 Tax=Apiospora phragmitis TaxID=2905665 RepID=A0ABR1TNP5_9PEZI
MKCRIDNGNTCRRCHRSGVPCIFVPRANAAGLPINLGILDPSQAEINKTVMRRLKMIEDYLGLSAPEESCLETDPPNGQMEEDEPETPEDHALSALWMAAAALEKVCPPSIGGGAGSIIWQRNMIKQLWLRFHETMPRLHFLPSKQTFSSPRPVLLASILYCSSARGTPEVAELAPHYFAVLCNAIAQLSIPNSEIGRPPDGADEAEEWAFQTVLGIILAGLLTEAYVRETGVWISVAYRLILEHCPPHADDGGPHRYGCAREWRRLFSGCQIVDLEHASLHLSCPVIPIEAPLPALRISPRDQLYRLSRMMHTGLAHFTGRGLPTIWSCFTRESPPPDAVMSATCSFSAVDAAVIRDWARQLDEWLVDFSSNSSASVSHDPSSSSSSVTSAAAMSEQDRTLVFRQYVLHRLVVLSIYHPARGCNLYSNSITPNEQFELLLSARATLRLHLNDKSIWSNWDFVMITWAALIVLQAVEGGAGELDDLTNIRIHLDMLRQTNEPRPSLRAMLVARLEQSLESVQTPSPTALRDPLQQPPLPLSPAFDYSWQIFDQASLQQMTYPAWPLAPQLQAAPMQ